MTSDTHTFNPVCVYIYGVCVSVLPLLLCLPRPSSHPETDGCTRLCSCHSLLSLFSLKNEFNSVDFFFCRTGSSVHDRQKKRAKKNSSLTDVKTDAVETLALVQSCFYKSLFFLFRYCKPIQHILSSFV